MPFHFQGVIPTLPKPPARLITAEQYEASLEPQDFRVIGQRVSRSNADKTLLNGFDPYATRKHKPASTSGGGGGGGCGGDGGSGDNGDAEEANDPSNTRGRSPMPTPAGSAKTKVAGGNGARGGRGGSRGGGIVSTHGLPLGKNNFTRCCCERIDCTRDVSTSEHYCSKTGRRCNAWCQTGEEGHGSKDSPCIRCDLVEQA